MIGLRKSASGPRRTGLSGDWQAALACVPGLRCRFFAGLISGRASEGLIAAGAAIPIGFGVFQSVGGSSLPPMALATLGMVGSTVTGSVVGADFGLLAALEFGAAGLTIYVADLESAAWWITA